MRNIWRKRRGSYSTPHRNDQLSLQVRGHLLISAETSCQPKLKSLSRHPRVAALAAIQTKCSPASLRFLRHSPNQRCGRLPGKAVSSRGIDGTCPRTYSNLHQAVPRGWRALRFMKLSLRANESLLQQRARGRWASGGLQPGGGTIPPDPCTSHRSRLPAKRRPLLVASGDQACTQNT